jgi:hypothetical protein
MKFLNIFANRLMSFVTVLRFARFDGVMRLVLVALCAFSAIGTYASEETIDFENDPPDLPKWRASAKTDGVARSWRATQENQEMSVILTSDNPKSGSNCMAVEAVADVTDMAVGTDGIEVSGPAVEISMFSRTEGLGQNGLFSVQQYDSTGERVEINWGVAKVMESDDWTELLLRLKLHPQTAKLRLSISYPSITPAGAKLWLDDITVRTIDGVE